MTLLATIHKGLREIADPERAAQMRAYMKSEMPYAGVAMPDAKRIFRAAFATYPDGVVSKKPFVDEARFLDDVRAIWDGAKVREERYAALELFTCARAKTVRGPSCIPLLHHIVVSGAWWDLVDWAAPNVLGPLLDTHPAIAKKTVLAWSADDNIWIRRSAILSQLHRKTAIDLDLLGTVLGPSLGDKEFFVGKAIGWMLRETAKKNPDFVRAYVDEHGGAMTKLSVREATKHLG